MNSRVIIHKENLVNNISVIKSRLRKDVQVMAVVKDNAYGHGFKGVAHCLSDHVDWFCVARAEEGVRLREIGVKHPILVFELPTSNSADVFPSFNLTATVASLDSIDLLKPETEYHINLDTGMHRLGILPSEVSELLSKMRKQTDVKPTGIYTHFSKADDPGNSEVHAQLELFKTLRNEFSSELFTHTANTGAIFHYSDLDLQFNAVRPGVSLFGYGAGDQVIDELTPAITWESFLMQVKAIKKGEPVSYGGRWLAPDDGYIGIIPVGYSSGILRILSNQIEFELAGIKFPQVGTISMDYSIIFLGNNKLATGTSVTILNTKDLNARLWARKAQTIQYEITTGINPMIERVFVD